MVRFTAIRPTRHYLELHADAVPWEEVVAVILASKSPRRKGGRFELERGGVYVLFEVREGALWVINAKRTGARGRVA